MAVLSNQVIRGPNVLNTAYSFGPFISFDEENFRFDTQLREYPVWLGHTASPMCGVLQHLECWTGEWTEEMLRIKQAYLDLLERTKDGLCGQLWLKPFEEPDPKVHYGILRYPAAMIYQYIAVSILEQFPDSHQQVADSVEANSLELFDQYGELFDLTFANGPNFEFGFEFKELAIYKKFLLAMPKAGIYNTRIDSIIGLPRRFPDKPNGDRRCVFGLNLGYRDYLDLFWQRMRLVLDNFQDESFEYEAHQFDAIPDYAPLRAFQIGFQKAQSNRKAPRKFKPCKFLESEFERRGQQLTPVIVTAKNYKKYRDRILQMQIDTYEPVRRSPPEEFDMLFESDNPLAIIVLDGKQVAAMVFAGQLALFTQERGVSTDPFLNDPSVYYSMDLTVAPAYRGGMGTLMKQALVMLAIDNGVSAIHGRNRDRLAAGMWAINLSLGSYELQRLANDYPDDEQYCDCIYYRCPLTWDTELTRHEFKQIFNGSHLQGYGVKSITLVDLSNRSDGI